MAPATKDRGIVRGIKNGVSKTTTAVAKATGTTENFVEDVAATALAGTGAFVAVEFFTDWPSFASSAAVGVTTAIVWHKLRKDA